MKITLVRNRIDGFHFQFKVKDAENVMKDGGFVDRHLKKLNYDSGSMQIFENPRYRQFENTYNNLKHRNWVTNSLKTQEYDCYPPRTNPDDVVDLFVIISKKYQKRIKRKFFKKDGSPKARLIDRARAKISTCLLRYKNNDEYTKEAKNFLNEQSLYLLDRTRFVNYTKRRLYTKNIKLITDADE